MAIGTIARLTERYFGFVRPEGGGEDLFFHGSAVRGGGFDSLRVGQRVEFDTEADPRTGRDRAANVRPAAAARDESGAAADAGDDEAEGFPEPGTVSVRYDSEAQMEEGVERLTGGGWTLRRTTRTPGGGAVAEFAQGGGEFTGPSEGREGGGVARSVEVDPAEVGAVGEDEAEA